MASQMYHSLPLRYSNLSSQIIRSPCPFMSEVTGSGPNGWMRKQQSVSLYLSYDTRRLNAHFKSKCILHISWTQIFLSLKIMNGTLLLTSMPCQNKARCQKTNSMCLMLCDLSLSQTAELYDFNLTWYSRECSKYMQLTLNDRLGKFCDVSDIENLDIENLVKSTQGKYTQKNPSWSIKSFRNGDLLVFSVQVVKFSSSRIKPNQVI